jgi:hypothetical protein
LRGFNEQNKCSVMPVPAGMLDAYRVSECWVTVWDRQRRDNLLFLGSISSHSGRRNVLLVGAANAGFHIAVLPFQRARPRFVYVTRRRVTLGFRGHTGCQDYSIAQRSFTTSCGH